MSELENLELSNVHIPQKRDRFSFKDFLLYMILTIMLLGGLAIAGFTGIRLLPDYKRKSIVYEIYVDCIKINQKNQCTHILKKLEGK